MIVQYLKEYRVWQLTYLVMLVLFYLTFYLYQLPMAYFGMSLLFNLTFFLLINLTQFYYFHRRLRQLQEATDSASLADFDKPVDLAYRAILKRQELTSEADRADLQSQLSQMQGMIKLWAHQMKVPLSAISLMSQTNHLETTEVDQQLLHLQHDVDNLLTYLKFHQHKDDFRFELLSARRLVLDLVKKYAVSCMAKELSVVVEGDWTLTSDKKWLSFALGQLLDNAIKYSKKGSQITITISAQGVAIADQGIGILEEDLPRLFEEGFTGFNGHEHQKATGLGLYITKQILDSLNLSITIESQVDVGTTVVIRQQR